MNRSNKLVALVIGLMFSVGTVVMAACTGPYCWDGKESGTMTGIVFSKSHPIVASSTTIAGLSGVGIGDMAICTTCANAGTNQYAVCFATSTTQPAYVLTSSTTVRCQ